MGPRLWPRGRAADGRVCFRDAQPEPRSAARGREPAGFVREGVMRQASYVDGGPPRRMGAVGCTGCAETIDEAQTSQVGCVFAREGTSIDRGPGAPARGHLRT